MPKKRPTIQELETILASDPQAVHVMPNGEVSARSFREDLEHIINCHSMENGSNTPDFLLAEYLTDCLAAFDKAVSARERWYGRSPHMLDNLPGPANP